MNQAERVLEHLEKHGSITPLEAMNDLGVMRLGARIWDLKAQGVPIKKEIAKGKNRYGKYTHFARYRLET